MPDPAVWQLLVSGATGAGLTYGLSWWRENKRTREAYRAPQREAIGDILTSTREYMLRKVAYVQGMTEYVGLIRDGGFHVVPGAPVQVPPVFELMLAMTNALSGVDRAFMVGALSIVDAPCFESMGNAYLDLERLQRMMVRRGAAGDVNSPDEVDAYVDELHSLSEALNSSVAALVREGARHLTPVESVWNWWLRRSVRRRIALRGADLLAPDVDKGSAG